MKKLLVILLGLITLLSTIGLVGCGVPDNSGGEGSGNGGGNTPPNIETPDDGNSSSGNNGLDNSNIIEFKTLTVNQEDNTAYAKLPNGTETFSFKDEINVSENYSYYVSSDIYGQQTILTKIVTLWPGDNVYYILIDKGNDDFVTYTVTLRVTPKFMVMFNTQGGSTIESQEVLEGELAIKPKTDPIRKGYTFTGWDFDFNTEITSNKTIKAMWQVNSYKVTFDGNGVESPENITVTYDSTYETLPSPSRTGYTFKGWYTASSGGTKVTADTKVAITENQTLYARWIADVIYSLQYDGMYSVNGVNSTEKNDIVILGRFNNIEVTSIGDYAFTGCDSLTSITIPSSVTSIGFSAFSGCSNLTSITIPDSVTRIGNYAFSRCDSLIYNEYENGLYLGNNENPYLVLVKMKDRSVNSFTFNPNIKFIGSSAFSHCASLESITIPNSVTSIGEEAFYNCTSLTSITFNGTIEQWNAISKAYAWDYNTGYYTIYCTDWQIPKS